MSVVCMSVVLQIGSALAQAVSRLSVNGPCGIRGAQSGSKAGVAVSTCCGFPLSVAHHQCSILICILIRSSTGVLISPYPDQEGNKLQRQKILIFIYPIYNHNLRNISNIYI